MTRLQLKKTRSQTQQKNQNNPSIQSSSVEQLTFIEHIYELRARLFWIVSALIITSAIGFQYKDILVDFIVAPLHGEKLIYLTPGGGFSFIFTVCLYFGALVTIPVIVYHIYRFLQPVLGQTSKKFIISLVLLSTTLAAAGAIFGYMVAIPAAISFLTTFAGDAVTPSLTAESYLGFVVAYLLGLAALFQLPLLLFIFDHVRPFPPGALLSSQRFVIVGAVIAAALITPTPDVINQMIVAGPIIAIYQLGALAVYVRRRGERRQNRNQSPVTPAQAELQEVPIPIPASVLSTTSSVVAKPQTSKKVQAHRAVDGFSATRVRSAPSTVRLPQRSQPVVAERPAVSVSAAGLRRSTPPVRSIDGFLVS
ncbi:TPA: twin-arginine translocase subunit TatC [Candidatus Saccharibacteria bacterium]|nr:MAG: Sec-independent protein translocase subunit TatC, sec-independent protein translocase protein TatC [Candidatus Saccharibacteria bacterium GW2011_GWC2_44_17]OGL33798.1 MAG: twin arginine-targeting protein translocase TatC [Candidatus Saccharibacteria bacterium RIFCSPHIGHO2_12_FULL_47_16]HBH77833.1 twin-arginine translocase subunit TatC [Candidatus Saccharibacteria bacterium]